MLYPHIGRIYFDKLFAGDSFLQKYPMCVVWNTEYVLSVYIETTF